MHSLLGDVLACVHRVGVQLNHGDTVNSEEEMLIEDTLYYLLSRKIDI